MIMAHATPPVDTEPSRDSRVTSSKKRGATPTNSLGKRQTIGLSPNQMQAL